MNASKKTTAAPAPHSNEDILDAALFLSEHADEDDAVAVETAAKAARIAAFLKAEGVADVLEVIRDSAEVAIDCRDGDPSFDARIKALRTAAKAMSAALVALS